MALSKRKIDSVGDYLQSIKKECVVEVKQEVSESYHVKFFADRGEIFRLLNKESPDREPADDGGCSFEKIAQIMCAVYISHLKESQKGRDKYIKLQLRWMEFVNALLHNPDIQPETMEIHEIVTRSVAQCPKASDAVSAIMISVTRSVFNVLQKKVVIFKEEESGQAKDEDCEDPVEEALVFIDEVSLHRLGGFALHSAIKASSGSEIQYLASLRLTEEEKETLPINLKVLDKGGLTFMKREMMGYLSEVLNYVMVLKE